MGWISVSEQLPEPDQYVLTCGGRILRIAHPARVLRDKDGNIEFWWTTVQIKPTHWMPMPAPPISERSAGE